MVYWITLNVDENLSDCNRDPLLILDIIKFGFDSSDQVQTDLFVKKTNCRANLYDGSKHPVNRSLVYSLIMWASG